MTFVPDYPNAIVVPAHKDRWSTALNHPKGWVFHTPEEPADDVESTPAFFQTAPLPGKEASSIYYGDSDGDIYQMVEERYTAFANGVVGKPYPSWANPSINLNSQSLNIEIEGFAGTIQNTMIRGGLQWNSVIKLVRDRDKFYNIPLDRSHHLGHYEVSNQRSDPGALFPWNAFIEDLRKEDGDMIFVGHNATASWFTNRIIGPVVNGIMQIKSDLNLPPEAKLAVLDVYLSTGSVVFKHGKSNLIAGVIKEYENHREVSVQIEDGVCGFTVPTGGVEFELLGIVGYWK